MEYASCVEKSTASDPKTTCECQLGRIMNDAQDEESIFFKQASVNDSPLKLPKNVLMLYT